MCKKFPLALYFSTAPCIPPKAYTCGTPAIFNCKNDVKDTEMLFKMRQDYFQAKFEIVNEFNLPVQPLRVFPQKRTHVVLQLYLTLVFDFRFLCSRHHNDSHTEYPRRF